MTDFGERRMPGPETGTRPASAGSRGLSAGGLESLVRSLGETQWWPGARLLAWQMDRFAQLLAHAAAQAPHYAGAAPAGPLTPERIRALPILTRAAIQDAGERLDSRAPPPGHGETGEIQTSGSTGRPVRVRSSRWAHEVARAITRRERAWHGRDAALSRAVIGYFPHSPKAQTPDGDASGAAPGRGPVHFLDSRLPLDGQLAWLRRVRPAYLMAYPTNLAALAVLSLERGEPLDSLVQARTRGETLSPEQRALVRRAWGVPVHDIYSAQEIGYIALQAPDAEHYLVQSEAVYLEVLDDTGEPCAPGAVGRVVVTALHNFATPLIRYELGDYAEVGPPAPCGRGLPVLTRVLGRVRNMLTLPDGSRIWPDIGGDVMGSVVPVRQYQMVQTGLTRIEARILPRQPFSAEQDAALRRHLESRFGPDFDIDIRYVEAIERGPTGKFEDFRSEVTRSS